MTDAPLQLPPCPFCEGPPVPIVTIAYGCGIAPRQDSYGDDGLFVETYTFCHECGAQGPCEDLLIYDAEEYDAAERAAAQRWMDRDARNRDCYDGSGEDGLNTYPNPVRAR